MTITHRAASETAAAGGAVLRGLKALGRAVYGIALTGLPLPSQRDVHAQQRDENRSL